MFDTEFTALAASMMSNAASFIGSFLPILAGVVGIAFAGLALVQIRRFIS